MYSQFLSPTLTCFLQTQNRPENRVMYELASNCNVPIYNLNDIEDYSNHDFKNLFDVLIPKDYNYDNLFVLYFESDSESISEALLQLMVERGCLPIQINDYTTFSYQTFIHNTISNNDMLLLLEEWNNNKNWRIPSNRPLPLCGGDEEGSFPYITVKERIPEIIDETIRANPDWSEEYQQRLVQLKNALIQDDPITRIPWNMDEKNIHVYLWNLLINREIYRQRHFMDVSWWFLEHYVYRYILHATEYYKRCETAHRDPFFSLKEQGLTKVENIVGHLFESIIQEGLKLKEMQFPFFHLLLIRSLWGNKADLSMSRGKLSDDVILDESSQPLLDQSQQVWTYLSKEKDPVITILSDNTGLELISDIIFCVFYLYLNRTSTINYIIKESPVFVSDITEYDMKYTIEWLSFHSNVYIQEVSKLLQDFIEKGRFRFIPQYTLGTCLSMWNIPTSLYSLFNESTLIISKGDANYRRFLNDSHWKYDTDCKEVLSYLPTPVVLLRTLKSNCLMGISEDLQKKARQLSQNWDINGKIGIIQFFNPNETEDH